VLPVPNITLSSDQSICLGDSVTLTATGGDSYLWSNSYTTASIKISPIITTSFKVTASLNNGCSKADSILVTIKPGQQYFTLAKKLKEKLEEQGKKAYVFVDNTFDLNTLENYPFIKAWVNTACPRIGTDDIVNIEQPMINLKDAFDPVKALEETNYGK